MKLKKKSRSKSLWMRHAFFKNIRVLSVLLTPDTYSSLCHNIYFNIRYFKKWLKNFQHISNVYTQSNFFDSLIYQESVMKMTALSYSQLNLEYCGRGRHVYLFVYVYMSVQAQILRKGCTDNICGCIKYTFSI